MSNKGQISSVDVIFALLTLLFIFTILLWGWQFTSEKLKEEQINRDLNLIAIYTSRSLVDTPGSPTNWHNSSTINSSIINSIGVSNLPGILNTEKFNYLVENNATNYNDIKKIIGVLGPGYELYVDYEVLINSSYENVNSFGLFPNGSKVVKVQRLILTDLGEYGKINLFVWKNENIN